MLDLPAPACIHGFSDCVGPDWLIRARPATDDGAIAKKRIRVGEEWLGQRAAQQFGTKARSIDVKVGFDRRPVLRHKRCNPFLAHLRTNRGIHDFHTEFAANLFQPRYQLYVLNMKCVVIMEMRQSIRLAGKHFVMGHER